MVRPRGGDFLYSEIEFEVMKREIKTLKSLNIDGIVFGILTKDGKVDKKDVQNCWIYGEKVKRFFTEL